MADRGDLVEPAAGRGRFIVFEGGEASGKSTQARLLAEARGALLTREPGGTALGERIRELLLDPATGDLDARTELLLMAAARAEHVERVIRPTLDTGRDVVCDRFGPSSIAYQGFGRGLPADEVDRVSTWAAGALRPDLIVLLDVDPDTQRMRLGDRAAGPDRLESAGAAFHRRVLEGFRSMAAADPAHWCSVDGSRPIAEIAAAIAAVVAARFDSFA